MLSLSLRLSGARTAGCNLALLTLYIAGLDMDGDIGVLQSLLNVLFQVVAHLVRLFHTGPLGHDQVQVNILVTA